MVQLHLLEDDQSWIGHTQGHAICIRAGYLHSHPWDVDVLTHELFHVVQDYGQVEYPDWAMEGLADYARHRYGLYNARGGWALPDFHPEQHYTDSYRVTARFFVWLERQHGPGHLESLDRLLRQGAYRPQWWQARLNASLDQLWAEYSNTN